MAFDSYSYETVQYTKFKKRIEQIIYQLNAAINDLDLAINEMENAFSIDYEAADQNSLSSIRKNIKRQRDFLKDKVLPKVETIIDEIKVNPSFETLTF